MIGLMGFIGFRVLGFRVKRGGSVTTFQCPNTVRIGFVGFGCEPGTILMPLVFMV